VRLGERLLALFAAHVRVCPLSPGGQARVLPRAIYILPTGAGLVFGGILILMLVGSLNYQNNLGLLFTFLATAIVLVSMHHAWFNLLGLGVTAWAGPPVFAGDPATFEMLISAETGRPRWDLRLSTAGHVAAPADMESGAIASARLLLPTQRRGIRHLGRLTLETRYPLGLFRSWCYLETAAEVLVYPRPADQAPVPMSTAAGREGVRGDRDPGADDFAGLRGYRLGDSPRQLDWKAYGRGRGLLVKQFGRDRSDRLWLDLEHLPPADIETRLSWLCRQLLDVTQSDQDFGLRLPGRELGLGRGEAQMHLCLGALARFGQAPRASDDPSSSQSRSPTLRDRKPGWWPIRGAAKGQG
jgi:uncharacterized protein (DUF58 family)